MKAIQPFIVKDYLFINQFCYGECHLLADVICHVLIERGYKALIYTCHSILCVHSFVGVMLSNTELFIDGSGVYTSKQEVFKKYGITEPNEIKNLGIEIVDNDNVKFHDLVRLSPRFQSLHDGDSREEEFWQSQVAVFEHYEKLVGWR